MTDLDSEENGLATIGQTGASSRSREHHLATLLAAALRITSFAQCSCRFKTKRPTRFAHRYNCPKLLSARLQAAAGAYDVTPTRTLHNVHGILNRRTP